MNFYLEESSKCTSVPDPNLDSWDSFVFGPPGSVSQKYGSEDQNPSQNVTDPQHWFSEHGKILT